MYQESMVRIVCGDSMSKALAFRARFKQRKSIEGTGICTV